MRYTYALLEECLEFIVNVPTAAMYDWVTVYGSRSGRDLDKIGAHSVAVSPGDSLSTITLDDSPMVYECRVVHHNDVLPPNLARDIDAESYASGDYHRVHRSEIDGAYAAAYGRETVASCGLARLQVTGSKARALAGTVPALCWH